MGNQIHATCVALDQHGVLIQGPSGSGKSDLALRLIDDGGVLVADDRVNLRFENNLVVASPPIPLAGLIEARGVGILSLIYQPECSISLITKLTLTRQIQRLPVKQFKELGGITLPVIELFSFDASTPAKIRLAIHKLNNGIIRKDD